MTTLFLGIFFFYKRKSFLKPKLFITERATNFKYFIVICGKWDNRFEKV